MVLIPWVLRRQFSPSRDRAAARDGAASLAEAVEGQDRARGWAHDGGGAQQLLSLLQGCRVRLAARGGIGLGRWIGTAGPQPLPRLIGVEIVHGRDATP